MRPTTGPCPGQSAGTRSRRGGRAEQRAAREHGRRSPTGQHVNASAPPPPSEIPIGIIAPHDLVERIMLAGTRAAGRPGATSAASAPGAPRRLVAAAYRDEQEAADMVVRLGPGIDACLFANQVPYEVARKAGVLSSPATFVPLAGSALQAALFRASRDGGRELGRASVDVLSRADVEDAFAELGIAARGLHVREA